jgi:hypothetical protein
MEMKMIRIVRSFLSLEAAVFVAAALVHAGFLLSGHEHAKAETAEAVIALVLLTALAATVIAPPAGRRIGLAAQGFALFGTLVGLFTIAIGIGPRTPFDLVLHTTMILLLVSGLLAVARHHPIAPPRRT